MLIHSFHFIALHFGLGAHRPGGHRYAERPRTAVRRALAWAGFAVGAALFSPARAEEPEPVYAFSTVAGSARAVGSDDGVGSQARFNSPTGIAVDRAGVLYIADDSNATIRRISTTGAVATIAGKAGSFGTVDGLAANARFSGPVNIYSGLNGLPMAGNQVLLNPGKTIAVSDDGSVYLADYGSRTIRKLSPSGLVTTLAGSSIATGNVDGVGGSARFATVAGIALEPSGSLLVTDTGNETIRRVTTQGFVTTAAGTPYFSINFPNGGTFIPQPVDGAANVARFLSLDAIALDGLGDIFVIDAGTLRKIAPGGMVSTVAREAGKGLAVDSEGAIFLTDFNHRRIRRLSASGVLSTVAGAEESGTADGMGPEARFIAPYAITIDREDNLYVTDVVAQTIRKGTRVRKPVINAQPAARTATAGGTVTLTVGVTSAGPVSYQWSKNGTALAGASTGTLQLTNLTGADAGVYTVTVANQAGVATSADATVTVTAIVAPPPVITLQPTAQAVAGGQALTLNVNASATGPLAYQWQKDGVNLPGATTATFRVHEAQATDAGVYRAVITAGASTVTTEAVTVTVNTSRIVNLSIRTALDRTTPLLTVGFVVAGGGTKSLLARAVGPSLRQFGVGSAHTDPRMTLFAGEQAVGGNDDWGVAPNAIQVAAAAAQVGSFTLAAGSTDAASLTAFESGGYSIQVGGPANSSGVVLVELYDANNTAAARLVNVSARAQVGTGDNLLVAGFVIAGNASRTLLIRAIGPTLREFGVSGVLADPKLELIAGGATPLASNDNWGGTPALSNAFAERGAFPLAATDSKDAALIITLEPGSYSAQISGVGGTTGEALVEIYEVP